MCINQILYYILFSLYLHQIFGMLDFIWIFHIINDFFKFSVGGYLNFIVLNFKFNFNFINYYFCEV